MPLLNAIIFQAAQRGEMGHFKEHSLNIEILVDLDTYCRTSSFVLLVKRRPFSPHSCALTLCRLSLYSLGWSFPRATIVTLFLPNRNLQGIRF